MKRINILLIILSLTLCGFSSVLASSMQITATANTDLVQLTAGWDYERENTSLYITGSPEYFDLTPISLGDMYVMTISPISYTSFFMTGWELWKSVVYMVDLNDRSVKKIAIWEGDSVSGWFQINQSEFIVVCADSRQKYLFRVDFNSGAYSKVAIFSGNSRFYFGWDQRSVNWVPLILVSKFNSSPAGVFTSISIYSVSTRPMLTKIKEKIIREEVKRFTWLTIARNGYTALKYEVEKLLYEK